MFPERKYGTTGCICFKFKFPAFLHLPQFLGVCTYLSANRFKKDRFPKFVKPLFSHADFVSLKICMSCSHVLNSVHDMNLKVSPDVENAP